MNYWLMSLNNVTLGKFNSEAEAIAGYEKFQTDCIYNIGKRYPCKLFYNFSKPMVYIRFCDQDDARSEYKNKLADRIKS